MEQKGLNGSAFVEDSSAFIVDIYRQTEQRFRGLEAGLSVHAGLEKALNLDLDQL